MTLIINETDISDCIQESAYKIDSQDVYTEYIDAGGIKHRNVSRQKITGSFDLIFVEGYSSVTYKQFLSILDDATNDGALTVSLYVNNLDEVKTIQCYYNVKFSPVRKISNIRKFRKCTVSLEER